MTENINEWNDVTTETAISAYRDSITIQYDTVTVYVLTSVVKQKTKTDPRKFKEKTTSVNTAPHLKSRKTKAFHPSFYSFTPQRKVLKR